MPHGPQILVAAGVVLGYALTALFAYAKDEEANAL